MSAPLICFGQQPCGIFPRRFLVSKILTARRLKKEIGGEVVFFYHDSDHDPRETVTILRDRHEGRLHRLNFSFANKLQKEFSPLFAKSVLPDWKAVTAERLMPCVSKETLTHFKEVSAENVADFCLQMYERLGLLEGVRVLRSGAADFRKRACAIEDFFVDVNYQNELVRARHSPDALLLHKGGGSYERLPLEKFSAEQISPTRDTRLRWMQSVIGCTHYIAGAGEMKYLRREEAPEIEFIERDAIEEAERAWLPNE